MRGLTRPPARLSMGGVNAHDLSDTDIARLAHEVRNLRRLVLAVLVMTLVFLTVMNVQTFFAISSYTTLFETLLGGKPLPLATRITLRIGDSFVVLLCISLLPIGSMIWLWLERERPALPVFVMLCLCVMMMIFLVWTRLTLADPVRDIIFHMM